MARRDCRLATFTRYATDGGLLVPIATVAVTDCAKTGDPGPWPPRLKITFWGQYPLPADARRPADGQALDLMRLTGGIGEPLTR